MLERCAGAPVRPPGTGEHGMSGTVARITHLSARSDTSFEDAVRVGVERAASTLRNVSGAWVKEQKVDIEDGRIVAWQVVLEVTFVLE
jgi:flavin-binding protein dodecin